MAKNVKKGQKITRNAFKPDLIRKKTLFTVFMYTHDQKDVIRKLERNLFLKNKTFRQCSE